MSIHTIGYGNRRIEHFIDLLKMYRIEVLIDIRTSPYSRFNPSYNTKRLQDLLGLHSIDYKFMGDTLGGKPKRSECYTSGEVDYKKIGAQDWYKLAIARLVDISKEQRIAIMCAELKPSSCHRKPKCMNQKPNRG